MPASTSRTPGLYRLGAGVPRASALPRRVRLILQRRHARALRQFRARVPARLTIRRASLLARPASQRGAPNVWDARLAKLILAGLTRIGNVRAIARAIGVSAGTLYHHRKADPVFAYHWEKALTDRYDQVEQLLLDHALNGWEEEVWYQGKCVGTRHCRDYRLGLALLNLRERRERGAASERRADAAEQRTASLFGAEMDAARRATQPYGATGASEEDGETAIAPRHRLFLNLMERHRGRHPHEWDGDVHIQSGFDFEDWRTWVDDWEARNLGDGSGAGGEGGA